MTKQFTILTALLATLFATLASAPLTRADIFQWEYIDPANPSLGRQQSTTLAPDGAGAQVAHGADLSNRNLTKAYLSGADLHLLVEYNSDGEPINYVPANLDNTNLSQAELPNSRFNGATLNNANLSQANLTNANFSIPYTYASPPFRTSLVGANLSQANLTDANFGGTNLSGTDFTAAEVRGANFGGGFPDGGLTSVQLYSTASYADRDLTDIGLYALNLAGVELADQNLTSAGLSGSNLTGADFSHATLTNADFSSQWTNLTDANLSHANLANATFAGSVDCGEFVCVEYPGATLIGAVFNGADTRGADFNLAVWGGAFSFNNTIMPDGRIGGLHLPSGDSLVVRDYDGNPMATPPITSAPILIYEYATLELGSELRLEFDANAWGSTISFDPGISVTLAGDLQLTFAPGVDVASQVGRTIDLFDWTGVTPIGAFNVSSPHDWDLTNLYTSGEVTLTAAGAAIPGDFNGDSLVNAADLLQWQDDYGVNGDSDADGDGDTDGADFLIWQRNLGATPSIASTAAAVPEPASVTALAWGLSLLISCAHRGGARKTF